MLYVISPQNTLCRARNFQKDGHKISRWPAPECCCPHFSRLAQKKEKKICCILYESGNPLIFLFSILLGAKRLFAISLPHSQVNLLKKLRTLSQGFFLFMVFLMFTSRAKRKLKVIKSQCNHRERYGRVLWRWLRLKKA